MRKYANVYKRQDGTYQLRFTIDGKRYAVYGRSIEECRQKEAEKREKIKEGITSGSTSFNVYAERWLSSHANTIKPGTVYMYRTRLSVLAPIVGTAALADITPQAMRDAQKHLLKEYSPGTVNATLKVAKTVLNAAVADGLINRPPRGIKALKTQNCDIHRALTREETKLFVDAAAGDPYRDLFVTMLHTGVRMGEALALTDSDISGAVLTITKTVSKDANGVMKYGTTAKTAAGSRVIPLDEVAQEALRNAQAIRDAIAPGNKHVFVSQTGRLPASPVINAHVREICKAAGIAPITSHALRDTFATRCAESKMQPRVLMDLLGHADIHTTMMIYVHVMDDVKEREFAAVTF